MQPDTQCHKFKKNYKFIFIYYSLCFRPTSFIVFEFKYPWSFTIYREFHTFFYIWREYWVCLISDNFMPNFNINIQILNFGAEFERCLWLHTVNPKRDVTSTKCEIFQTMFMPELRLIRNILRIFVNQIGDKTPFSPQTL